MFRQSSFRLLAALALLGTLCACGRESAVGSNSEQIRLLKTPAAEDSLAPRLATGPDGTLVMSWLEPQDDGNALRFSRFEDGRWAAAETVTSGDNWFVNWADIPSVVPISGDLWGAHWLVAREAFGEAYDINAAISSDGGHSWSSPVTPHTDNTDTEHGFVSMFANAGGVGMLWLDGRKFVNEVTDDVAASGMTLRTATFGPDLSVSGEALVDELICDCCQTDVAMTSEGPVAVYRNRTADEIRDIYVTRYVNGSWQPGQPVHNDNWEIYGCPVNGPSVDASGTRVAVAWFSAPNDQAKVQAAWSTDAGKTFSDPVEVSSERPLGHVGAALLPNGDLAVSWHRSTADGGTELCLRRVSPTGDSGAVHVLEEAADVSPFSVPQLARHGDEVIVAWTSETDDTSRVESLAVPIATLN
jgi:hypothetical protein